MKKLFVALPLIFAAAFASAQFPDKPMRVVVGYPPGGVGDAISRIVAELAAARHKQPVIVDNRPGANGLIGAQYVAAGPKDGSAIFQCAMGTMAIVPNVPGSVVPFDVENEMTPIATVMLLTFGLVTASDSPYQSVGDVLRAAKANPGKVSYATTGSGSAQHLATQMMATVSGTSLLHVPYKGSGQAITDLIGRNVDVFLTSISDASSLLKAKRLRLLGLADSDKHPEFPGIPAIAESVPKYNFQSWMGICGPKGMSAEATREWADTIREGLKRPDVQQKIQALGATPHFEGPEAFDRRLRDNRAHFKEVVMAAKIRAD